MELKQVVNKPPEIERDELVGDKGSPLWCPMTPPHPSGLSSPHFSPQQPDALETFNRGAMVGLLVVAVAIAMVMVISLLLVRRKPYGTISHGIVEVRN